MAFESATESAGVAMADESGVIASATTRRGRRHAESIAPAIDFVCRRSGSSLRDLDGVCVDVGPGLFTGLRVGVATAKAVAFALGVPVYGAGSLEILALALASSPLPVGSVLVPVVDARRGEVFSARFRAGTGDRPHTELARETEDRLWTPKALATDLEELSNLEDAFFLAGDGALRYRELFEAVPGCQMAGSALASPPVETLAAAGAERLAAGEGEDPLSLSPRYLRHADVRINWEKRLPPRAVSSAAS
jgi:tRNA threonylcarbamoyladenosine biosynthesis protein TsaB